MIDVEMLRPTADEMLSGISAGEALKRRLLFQADAVNNLPRIAGEMLGGLHVTPALRHRILLAAERKQQAGKPVTAPKATRRPAFVRLAPAAGMALVLTIMIALGASYGSLPTLAVPGATPGIQSDFDAGMAGATTLAAGEVPQYRSLFAGDGANPPLVGINGRFYRMLNVPVPQDVIGTQISEVAEFTEEPSLNATVGTVSNIAKVGTRIYAVDGLSNKTACIVEVDGAPRLFQRFGYASATLLGNELFEDTLDINGQVSALELSGVGVITDEGVANELIYTLSEFAVFHGNDVANNSGQALTIYLNNGLSLQLMVQEDVLGACGAWACPEFFDTFISAL